MLKNKNTKEFKGWINPLIFTDLELVPLVEGKDMSVSLENVLNFISAPGISSNLEDLINRYNKIGKEAKRLIVVPNEENILTKLIWPLRNAIGCYMVGNYIGTISLCGMVAEMVSILLFEISNIQINGQLLDEEKEKMLFGSKFEKLSQDKRIKGLRACDLINDELKEKFDNIRAIRRKYLHLYSTDHSDIACDAVNIFEAAIKIVEVIIGQGVEKGAVMLNPNLIKYLEARGILYDESN